MATKPTVLPEWNSTETRVIEPTSTQKSSGWVWTGTQFEKPKGEHLNFWMNSVYKWVSYLDSAKALINGDSAQTFKVAPAINAEEAIAFGQLTGYVLPFATSTVPNGFLECNGAELSRTTYTDLFAVLGTTYGVGDGSTTFNIPDLRGEFIRGFDNGRGIDSARNIGTNQLDSFKEHTHNYPVVNTSTAGSGLPQGSNGVTASDTYPASSIGGTETRPRNIAMMYCIKY